MYITNRKKHIFNLLDGEDDNPGHDRNDSKNNSQVRSNDSKENKHSSGITLGNIHIIHIPHSMCPDPFVSASSSPYAYRSLPLNPHSNSYDHYTQRMCSV
jgi:hypothetical protein